MNELNKVQPHLGGWELLSQFCQAYRLLSDSMMDQVMSSRAQAAVLCKLFAQDGMTQSEIAQQLAVQGATVTDMLQRMEEAGVVTRRRDPDDNRLVRVYLTDVGREKERAVIEQFLKLEDRIFADFDEAERAKMCDFLNRMLHNMTTKG